MTTGHVFIATSLDGFIARPNDDLDWLMRHAQDGQDTGYDAFMDSVDGLIMGRGTFQTVLGFGDWPYPKPTVVLSQSLGAHDVPEDLRERVRISAATPADLMRDLAGQGWQRAYVDGGSVIQSFLKAGLIEDMIITTAPVLIGAGKPLFGDPGSDIDLTLVESHIIPPAFVQSTYRINPVTRS